MGAAPVRLIHVIRSERFVQYRGRVAWSIDRRSVASCCFNSLPVHLTHVCSAEHRFARSVMLVIPVDMH